MGDGVVPISENNESKDDDQDDEGRSEKTGNRVVRSWNINNPPGSLNLLLSRSPSPPDPKASGGVRDTPFRLASTTWPHDR